MCAGVNAAIIIIIIIMNSYTTYNKGMYTNKQ